jgi:hypothetical protein
VSVVVPVVLLELRSAITVNAVPSLLISITYWNARLLPYQAVLTPRMAFCSPRSTVHHCG